MTGFSAIVPATLLLENDDFFATGLPHHLGEDDGFFIIPIPGKGTVVVP